MTVVNSNIPTWSRFNFMLSLEPWPLYYGGTALAVLKCRAQVDVSSTGSCRTSLRVGCEDRIFGKAEGHGLRSVSAFLKDSGGRGSCRAESPRLGRSLAFPKKIEP